MGTVMWGKAVFGGGVAAILAMSAGQAEAQGTGSGSASTQITITGHAGQVCSLPEASTGKNAVFAEYSGGNVTLTRLIDGQSALVNPSSIQIEFQKAMCNYSASLSLASKNNGLVSSNASTLLSGEGFITKIPYIATVTWGRVSLTLDTAATSSAPTTVSVSGANHTDLTVSIATQQSTLPVPQGTYSDTLTLQIGAPL